MAHVRLFLSTVSAEFMSYRERLRHLLDRPNVTVKVQEDFIVTGDETLEMLDTYIRACDGVIHLVGDMTGAIAKPPSLVAMRVQYPELAERLRLSEFLQPEGPSLSYTQWEAWLTLLHGKPLFIATPTPEAPRDPDYRLDPAQQGMQQAHLAKLNEVARYAGVAFSGKEHLAAEVLRSFVLDLLVEAGLTRQPTSLHYQPLGDLLKGRDEELQKLQQQLGPIPENAATPSTAVALIGMGGVGKTRLAIEHAWRNAARHSAVLFAPASTPEALNRTLAGLALVLDLPQKAATEAVQRQAVIHWLGSHPGWLLILDGIDGKAAAQAVEALLPQISGGQVLFTTRLSKWSAVVERLPLEVLSAEAAAAFLLERTAGKRREEPGDPAMARELAQDLDGLALALEQAGAYIDERGISFSRYRKDWQERREKVLSWFDPQLMQYPASVATTWLTSFQQLSAGAQTLLRRLAWLSPEPIPESLLDVAVPGGDGETSELIEAMESLVELDRYSLVSRSRQSDSFLLHRLVQEVGRQGQRQKPATSQLEPALRWLDATFQGDPQDVRSWPVLDPLAAHVKAVAGFANAAGLADPTAQLMNKLGLLLNSKAAYAEAEPLLRRSLAIVEAAYGPGHPAVATALNNLALLLQATNRLAEAEPLMRRVVEILEAAFGPDHPAVATAINNLAQLLQATNRLSEAEPLMSRVLAIDEASYGPDHPVVARDLNNLALLLKATNRLAEAESLMRRSLAIVEAAYGPGHPAVATALNNLALLLQATNRLAEAEPLMRRVVEILEAAYGPDHPAVATALNNLAAVLQATNRVAEAEPLLRRTLAIDEAASGADHPAVARDLNNLAQLLQATNRLSEAEPLMRRALAIDEAAYGPEHPEVARDLNNLAQLLQATNRLAEAEPLLRRALAIFEAAYGPDHPYVATALNNLALLLQATNRLAEAEPLMRHALVIDEAAYGPDHPDVARDLNNLAQLLQATNRLSEAEPLMRRALAIDEAASGLDHPVVARDLNNLAGLLLSTNRLSEAELLMRRVVEIFEAAYGPGHPAVATALNNLAQLLQATNRLVEAEPLLRRALAIDLQ